MFGGIILFLIGIGVTAWNEGRAVKTAQGLAEGSSAVVSVDSATADSANEGKLVHLSGLATTTETLRDDIFGLEAKALRLKRHVEMLQWKEKSSSKTETKVGGSTETTTTYTYEKAWSDKVIPSDEFKEADKHRNPGVMPLESASQTAKVVTLGGFQLGSSLAGRVGNFSPLPPPAQLPAGFKAQGNTIYRSMAVPAITPAATTTTANPLGSGIVTPAATTTVTTTAEPQIGDVRITFEAVKPSEVSVIAQQRGSKLEPYRTKAGTTLELEDDGVVPAAAVGGGVCGMAALISLGSMALAIFQPMCSSRTRSSWMRRVSLVPGLVKGMAMRVRFSTRPSSATWSSAPGL